MAQNRRDFLRSWAAAAGVAIAAPVLAAESGSADSGAKGGKPPYKISLAEWSFHRALQNGEMKNIEFPKVAKEEFGIDGVEWVNQFFMDKAKDHDYLTRLKKTCGDLGVKSLLIMIDGEGALGDPDEAKRNQAVENHKKWVEAAEFLGCHSIRVNAQSGGSFVEALPLAADGLRKVCEFADPHGINVIVENHGGLSSNGAWLSGVMELVDHPRVGTLPDFGNFNLGGGKEYGRYKGVEQLMPYAKAVSAKSHDFDAQGNETHTDYRRMMAIVTTWGYDGYVGIEYEGSALREKEGVRATKQLLVRVREELAGHA